MASNNYFLKGSITRGLIRFAAPVMLSMILQIIYSATDLIIVGNFATKADISAVAISSQLMTTVLLGVSGITTGLSVLVGQFSGAGSSRDVRGAIGSAVIFFALFSAGITVLLVSLNGVLISLMKTPPEAVAAARSYLLICSLATTFIVGYNVTSGILRGLGNSKTPLLFVAIASAINIVLDLTFIKGVGMGATGAALATAIAQAGSFLFSILFLRKKGIGLQADGEDSRLRREDIRLRREYVSKMIRIGLPISVQEVLINVSFLFITAVVNKMGVVASAAVGTVEKLISFLMMPTMAVSVAVATMAAHNFGARQPDRAQKCLWAGIRLSLAVAVPVCAFCWISGATLTSLFSRDSDVIREASFYLRTYSLDCVAVAFVFNFNSFFSSSNKSVFSMTHSLLTTFLVRVPFVFIAGGMAGVTLLTIGLAAPLSSLGSLLLCLFYFIWLSRKMKEEASLPAPCDNPAGQ